ncbi:hypothetical protein [Tolypothrix sp. VBCCA 56010]|uniref:hypothetical protein n=1 Tax=Tolypothrix sp. VBCCA 56010 TaxID=3137731 RepID=UPI003D7C434A
MSSIVKKNPNFNLLAILQTPYFKAGFFLVLLIVLLALDFLTRHSEWDQAVAYQRALRMLRGEVPFKDFFLLYLPLSVYLNSLVLHAHTSFLTIKIVGLVVCSYIMVTAYFTTKYLTKSITAGLVTALLTYFFALKAWPESNYSWYSVAAIITMLFIIISDYDITTNQFKFDSKRWLSAGVFLGISFCIKHNFAILILLATLIFLAANLLILKGNKRNQVVQTLVGLVLGLLRPILLMIIYLTFNQALTAAYKDIVLGAGYYVEFMTFPYLNILSFEPLLVTQPLLKSILGCLEFIVTIPIVLAAPLVGSALIIYSLLNPKTPPRQLFLFFGLICNASFSFLFPRSDYPHLAFALPILLIGTVVSFTIICDSYQWKNIVFKFIGIYLVSVSLLISIVKTTDIYNDNLKYIPISASFVSPEVAQQIQLTLDSLNQTQASGKQPIILDPSLSLYYPFLNISNPTRYDFPTKGNFGINNGNDIIAYLKSHDNICLYASKYNTEQEFYPSEILQAIQPIYQLNKSIGSWDIYCR